MSKGTYFSIKYKQSLGDRLVLCNPAQSRWVAGALFKEGIENIPGQITVGYYRELEHPDGAWCFMPVATAEAKAALTIPMVQARIAKDLITRAFPDVVV